MHCRDCDHWEPYESGLGGCLSSKWVSSNNASEGSIHPDGVMIENPSRWGVLLGPEFGCIHFTEKGTKWAF